MTAKEAFREIELLFARVINNIYLEGGSEWKPVVFVLAEAKSFIESIRRQGDADEYIRTVLEALATFKQKFELDNAYEDATGGLEMLDKIIPKIEELLD